MSEKQTTKIKFPQITQQEILRIDAPPNWVYPIKILQAYRENCNCKWHTSANLCIEDDSLFSEMNKMQDERAELLDNAIKVLQKELAP